LPAGHSQDPLRIAAANRLKELCERFPLGYEPELVWRGYRVTAGLAYYRKGVIGLSYRVLKDESHVLDTLVHEYAHLLAVARHGPRAAGHGDPWKQAMQDLGQEAKVRHNYPVERNTPRQKVTYVCLRCGKPLVRARRLPRRKRYIHANCGGDLRLASVEKITVADQLS
jgi:SprT protein